MPVTVNLYSFVEMYSRVLDTTAHILAKGARHAKTLGASEADMLDWRLADDMNPLRFQVMLVCNYSRLWPSRAAGLPAPVDIASDLDLAGFQAAIVDAKAYLAGLTPEQFAGRDDVPLTVKLGDVMEPTLPAGRWLTAFATTNINFHMSMAYAILRSKGVQIGKADLFPTGL
jgi:uncharacterized protein